MKPKRIISFLLAICLVAGLMPTVAFATGSDKAIMLGTEHLQGAQADNIYFGNYFQSNGATKEPVKWRVLSNSDGKLFLLSDQNLDVFQYHTDWESVTWEKSTMRSWLNGYGASENTGGDSGTDYTSDNFIGAAFSEKEQKAIAETTVVNDDNPEYNTDGGNDTTDQIFLLSIEEALNTNYGFNSSYSTTDAASGRVALNTAYAKEQGAYTYSSTGAGDWWLRSPGYGDIDAALVDGDGCLYRLGFSVGNNDVCVRPAFNLNLNSVLFTSAAEGGKSASSMDSGLTAVNDYTGNEWKLTLLDEAHKDFNISNATITGSGDTITFSYSDAQTGTNEYISVVIEDSGAITHYGRILQLDGTTNSASGTASLTLPAGVTLGDTTKLYVFNEQYNGDKMTDYASQLKEISSPPLDETAPTLTAGTATRTGETTATVKFTSDEAGSYYYEVVNSGENQPTIDTAGTGTTCDTTEQTISLTNLSDTSAKDIYIVVKDAAANVSQPLKITIPAYIVPSYGISASPAALNFGSKTVDYTEAPAAQTVTLTNTGNQNVTVDLPTSTNYIITAGEGFTNDTATLAPNGTADFTVQPNTGLAVGSHSETLNISGSDGTSASVKLSFTVAFATESDKAIMLGTSGISDPTSTQNSSGTHYTPSDYVYFGVKGSDPIKWRVLDADKTNDGTTSGMFLLSEYLLDSGVVFESAWNSDDNDGQSNPNEWQHSDAQNWCSTFATNTDVFSTAEQAAFLGVAKTDSAESSLYRIPWGASSLTENDKVFFLSVRELADYVGNYDGAPGLRATDTAQSGGYWWLRSPRAHFTDYVGAVTGIGLVDSYRVDNDWAARPAFNLNLNSVLFTSAAVGGKSSAVASGGTQGGEAADAIFEIGDYSGNEWKLTLLDSTRNSFAISNATMNSSGDTITFSYSGAQTGTNEYISVVLETNNEITHYGRILQLDGTTNSASGTASLTLPAGVTLSGTTKLYVFNEQYNGDKMTDYASQLKEISPTVDTTAPTLTAGTATRTGKTTATVKFTSDEAGSYYYVLDNSATAPDSINTSGEGTSCSANTETTISLDSLSGEYIHIVVKDADNNVSDILTIQIPAYTFTVTVNVDPSEGGTASASPTTAAPNTEITLTATPETGYHFKEWQVTSGSLTISDGDKVTNPLIISMPAENVTVKAVFEAHSFTQENTDNEYLASSATCTQAATYYISCSCGAKGTETFTSGDALGHTPGADWKHDNGSTHWKLCENCGAKVEETAHVYDNEQDIICNDCGYVKPTYAISASPETLDFGSEAEGYADAPAAQIVTITNIGNQSVTVNLPTSAKYIITAGTGFENGTATLASDDQAVFTVQPKTGLDVGSHDDTLNISGSDGTSASVELSFTVNAVYTLTVNLNGGSGSTTGGEYAEGAVIHIDAGSRSNYRFDGWTSSNGGSFADASSASTTFTMPATDTTITANWTYSGGGGGVVVIYYRLTFDTNGGNEIAPISRAANTTVDLSGYTPTREGYEFTGWYADEDLTDKITSIRLTHNTTIYAGWKEIKDNPSTGFENPFTDVSESDWFYEDVMFVFANGLMVGTGDATFSPEISTSRAMIAVTLRRMEGEPAAKGANSYTDVENGAWYTEAITWANENGIAEGYGNGCFQPETPVTREQLAAFFYRYAEYKGYDITITGSLDRFNDKDNVSEWAKEVMAWAVGYGLIGGKDNNMLDPQGEATRAEFAAMLQRFCQKG